MGKRICFVNEKDVFNMSQYLIEMAEVIRISMDKKISSNDIMWMDMLDAKHRALAKIGKLLDTITKNHVFTEKDCDFVFKYGHHLENKEPLGFIKTFEDGWEKKYLDIKFKVK